MISFGPSALVLLTPLEATALSNIAIPLLLGTANARRQATPANVIYDEYVKRRPNLSQEQPCKIENKKCLIMHVNSIELKI